MVIDSNTDVSSENDRENFQKKHKSILKLDKSQANKPREKFKRRLKDNFYGYLKQGSKLSTRLQRTLTGIMTSKISNLDKRTREQKMNVERKNFKENIQIGLSPPKRDLIVLPNKIKVQRGESPSVGSMPK